MKRKGMKGDKERNKKRKSMAIEIEKQKRIKGWREGKHKKHRTERERNNWDKDRNKRCWHLEYIYVNFDTNCSKGLY